MDTKRLHKKNKIIEEIKEIDITISRDIKSIGNLKSSKMDLLFVENSVNKLTSKIEEKTKRKKEIEEELKNLEQGLLDVQINKELLESTAIAKAKNDEKSRKRIIIIEQKAEDDEKSNLRKVHDKEVNSMVKQQHRDIKYSEKHFFKAIESFPQHIDKKLETMPSNKGFVWKGVHFYGKLASDSNTVSVFDKQYETLFIHEWNNNTYNLYSKIGKNEKTLISSKKRRQMSSSFGTISDSYVINKNTPHELVIIENKLPISNIEETKQESAVSGRDRGAKMSGRGRGGNMSGRGRGGNMDVPGRGGNMDVPGRGRSRGRGGNTTTSDRGRGGNNTTSDRGRGGNNTTSDRGRGGNTTTPTRGRGGRVSSDERVANRDRPPMKSLLRGLKTNIN